MHHTRSNKRFKNSVYYAIIYTVKNSISVTIEKELLEKVKSTFPNKNRSQVIEEALEYWIAQCRNNSLKNDAKLLIDFMDESCAMEKDALEDGLEKL